MFDSAVANIILVGLEKQIVVNFSEVMHYGIATLN